MRWRRCAGMRGRGRAGPPAPAPPTRCRRSRRRQPHALGTSAGVRGHGAAGRAGGTAPTARSQTSPFHIGMGEAAEAASDGGAVAGDGGARDARAICRGRRAPRPAAQHTTARRRVRTGRASTVTSPLSASRADEKQLPASTEQVRERRARVGGRGGGRGAARRRQEGRAAAEGDALVGAHGRAPPRALPARRRAAALRHGAAPRRAARAARRVTPRRELAPSLPYHAYIPLSGRWDSPQCTRVPEYYRLGIYLFGGGGPRRCPRSFGAPVFLAPSKSFAKTKTEIK
ncbi:unnamed protein product [Chrysodeixis includens]|uniref:Uncharacterized protein n=1 Tax=Chrysodeixis includens TaxID=689277 RepID=A0A9N8Q0M7_CHRIL|nr:unnamed protein product [Chrysodeixis includens]